MFHPNIDENEGLVSFDFFLDNWSPTLTLEKCILSVQSLLDSPNPDEFLNEKASKLYKENLVKYEEKVKEYTKRYANFIIFEDKLSRYNFNIKHNNTFKKLTF